MVCESDWLRFELGMADDADSALCLRYKEMAIAETLGTGRVIYTGNWDLAELSGAVAYFQLLHCPDPARTF